MAAAYRSSASANTGGTAATSVSVALPAGLQVGDVLLVSVAVDGGTAVTITPPAGFSNILRNNVSTTLAASTYWRLVDGTETSPLSFSFGTAHQASIAALAYSGCHPYAPTAKATNSATGPATAVTPAGANATYSGRYVQLIAGTTTSGAYTVTPANTEREDTCTTATPFVGMEVQDGQKSFPLGGTSQTGSTASVGITYATHLVLLEDARPPFNILEDNAYSVGSSTTSALSIGANNFQNYGANQLLLCMIAIHKGTSTVASITGGTLTWELVARANAQDGSSEIWRAYAAAQVDAQTFTITFSASVTSCNICMVSIKGADVSGTNGEKAIGAVVTGSSTNAAPSVSITTTRDNAWVWGVMNDGASAGSITAGSGYTIVRSFSDGTNNARGWMQRRDTFVSSAGTTVAFNSTNP